MTRKPTEGPLVEPSPLYQDDRLDTESILVEARERFRRSMEAWDENRKLAEEDIDFRNGDQWPEQVRKQREQEARPCLTFNKLEQRIDQVVGDHRQNRTSIQVHPVGGHNDRMPKVVNLAGTKDYELAEVYTGLIRNIEVQSNANFAYDTAFDHAVGHGFGFFRIVTEYVSDDVFEQDIRIRRIKNPFTVYFDPDIQEPDGSDANFCFITALMSKDEFQRRFPKAEPVDWDLGGQGEQYDEWYDGDRVRVAEYFRRVPVPKTIHLLSDGRVVENSQFDKIKDELAQRGVTVVRSRKVKGWRVEWFLVAGGQQILEGPRLWPGKYIPVIPVFGKELVVRGRTIYRGLIRHAKDAQRAYNFWRTATTEAVALAPKAPWLIADQQIGPHKHLWDIANRANLPYLPYRHVNGIPMPQRQPPGSVPTGGLSEVQMADQDLDATTGMYKASLGAPSNERSGKAIMARQREGDVGTFQFHDNLVRAIKHCGRILVDLIPKIYDTQRVVRLLFQDGRDDYVEINQTIIDEETGEKIILNDLSVGRYDVVVTTGPSYTTQRQEVVEAMVQIAQANPEVWQIAGDIIAKNMDWPGAEELAERFRKALPPELRDTDDPEAQDGMVPKSQVDQIVQQAVAQAEETAKKDKELQIKEYEAQTHRMRVEAEAAIKKAQLEGKTPELEDRIKDLVAQAIAEFLIQQQHMSTMMEQGYAQQDEEAAPVHGGSMQES